MKNISVIRGKEIRYLVAIFKADSDTIVLVNTTEYSDVGSARVERINQEKQLKIAKFIGRYVWVLLCVFAFLIWQLCLIVFQLLWAFIDANFDAGDSNNLAEGGVNHHTGEYEMERQPNEIYDDWY